MEYPCEVSVDGIVYTINSVYNKIVFNEIVNRNIYNVEPSDFVKNDTLVDIGGNVGYFSLYCHNMTDIFTFEPEAVNHEALVYNVNKNNLTNIKIFNEAVADTTKQMPFHVSKASANRHTLEELRYTFSKPTTMVNCKGINEVFAGITSNRCMLKMDVEGGEFLVLPALNDASIAKINTMFLELHEYPDKDWSHTTILNLLDKWGFKYTIKKDCENKWYTAYIVKAEK